MCYFRNILFIFNILYCFFVLSTAAVFKNDKKIKCTLPTRKHGTLSAFITACSHTTKMQKALILIEFILWGQLRFRGGAF